MIIKKPKLFLLKSNYLHLIFPNLFGGQMGDFSSLFRTKNSNGKFKADPNKTASQAEAEAEREWATTERPRGEHHIHSQRLRGFDAMGPTPNWIRGALLNLSNFTTGFDRRTKQIHYSFQSTSQTATFKPMNPTWHYLSPS